MKQIMVCFSPLMAMKGEIDSDGYCGNCGSNEFCTSIATSCAYCGTDNDRRKTEWLTTDEEERYVRAKIRWVNERTPKIGLSAYSTDIQQNAMREFDVFWKNNHNSFIIPCSL